MSTNVVQGRVFDRVPIPFHPKSLQFPALAATVHRPVLNRIYGTVLDQGNIGACVCHAGAHAVNGKPLHVNGTRLLTHADAINDYIAVTNSDPYPGAYPGQDTGTDADSLAKVYRSQGRITEWRNARSLDQIIGELQAGNNVLFGIDWRSSMFDPDPDGTVHLSGSAVGGHEVLIRGDNPRTRKFRVRNSWGRGWGLYGEFLLAYEDAEELLNANGDAIVLVR